MKYLFAISLLLVSIFGYSQVDSTTPPYKRFPTLPPLKLLLSDSTTFYSKDQIPTNKPVLFMLFSPECSHCQHETEELVAHKDDLKDIQIVMVTLHPLWMMNDFITNYKLKELPNVVVGKDIYYTFPSFYNIHNLPFLAMYNKDGKLITVFEGALGMDKVAEIFKKNQ